MKTYQLIRILEEFLEEYDATLLGIQESKRDNFERFPAPGNGSLQCFTAEVLFHNIGIFGNKVDYLEDVYPRITTLNMRLASFLEKKGLIISGSNAVATVCIVPHADKYGDIGKSLPPTLRPSRGQLIIRHKTLTEKSTYYATMAKRYGESVGVVTNNGTVVGPDGGLIGSACRVADTYENKISVLEFGSGGGSTALALARKKKLKSFFGNDFSPEMVEYFTTSVTPILSADKIKSPIFLGSCFDMSLETKVDLISVGVYYQAQTALFNKRGHELVKCLNKSGALIIQSSMQEDPFNTELLSGELKNNSIWPWYNKNFHLNTFFRYVARYIIEQETVLIATNSREKFLQIAKVLSYDGNFQKLNIA